MTRDELIAERDRIQAEIDALPVPDAELVQELTRVHMDGEHAEDDGASNYEDSHSLWRDVTASGVRAVLTRLRELGWRAPTDPRPLPQGVTVNDVATRMSGHSDYASQYMYDAAELLDLLNIEH